VIKLRQGFGRLIRTQQDRGIVVILDPRVRTKPYGRTFLQSLPECRVVDESIDEENSEQVSQ
jgi:ATP-dependent DNA helicase DinG